MSASPPKSTRIAFASSAAATTKTTTLSTWRAFVANGATVPEASEPYCIIVTEDLIGSPSSLRSATLHIGVRSMRRKSAGTPPRPTHMERVAEAAVGEEEGEVDGDQESYRSPPPPPPPSPRTNGKA